MQFYRKTRRGFGEILIKPLIKIFIFIIVLLVIILFGLGKSMLPTKKMIAIIAIAKIESLINRFIGIVLKPRLVFLFNCIYYF